MSIEIDGAQGEGGGQILRTALALSVLTGKTFSLNRIRANRGKPGLLRQHLTCVQAAAEISSAHVEGAELGSATLRFEPEQACSGDFHWQIGTAGSTSLVFQTVLYPLLHCGGETQIRIEGGTHNSMSPPFEFLDLSLKPHLEAMGYGLSLSKLRSGFFPAGGGIILADLVGKTRAKKATLNLSSRTLLGMEAYAWSANIPVRIGKAEVDIVGAELGIAPDRRHAVMVNSLGPGNAVSVVVDMADGKLVFTSFGEPRLALERVAANCVTQVRRFIESGARVDEHLQDQLLLPMSLGSGGRFTTTEPSLHTRTNMDIIKRFLDVEFECEEHGSDLWEITVKVNTERSMK